MHLCKIIVFAALNFLIMGPGELPAVSTVLDEFYLRQRHGVGGCRTNLDTFVDHNLRVGVVIRRHNSREERDVNGEGLRCHRFAALDLLTEICRSGLG